MVLVGAERMRVKPPSHLFLCGGRGRHAIYHLSPRITIEKFNSAKTKGCMYGEDCGVLISDQFVNVKGEWRRIA
jgi:hypothetical protein